MVSAHILRLLLSALLSAGATLPARALQLGETKAQILARHGVPGAEDRRKDLAMYFWEGWSARLEFKNGAVQQLTYRRGWYLQDSEIEGLLHSNGGLGRWREVTAADAPTRQWTRDDGATATCATARPLIMTFSGGRAPVPVAAAPTASITPATPLIVVPVAPPVVSSTPPTFPKSLGRLPEPAPEPVEAAPAVPEPAPEPRSLPKLKVEESEQEPVAPVAQPAPEPELVPAPAASHQSPVEPAATPMPSPRGHHGWVIGLLAVFGAIAAAGIYLFKSRAGHKIFAGVKSRIDASRHDAAAVAPVATPALDALRSDQFELLVGEIFRREGYAVELSAATALDDNIDLTLRRDSETILVECKHWKTSRVTEREIREFYGAMTANGSPRGIFVTAGSFSRDARELAEGKEIDLMDRAALEESVGAVTRAGEDFYDIASWIEEFTAQARVFDPECPICKGGMVIRNNRASGVAFWSCRNHPRCPGRREPRLDLLAVGAAH